MADRSGVLEVVRLDANDGHGLRLREVLGQAVSEGRLSGGIAPVDCDNAGRATGTLDEKVRELVEEPPGSSASRRPSDAPRREPHGDRPD